MRKKIITIGALIGIITVVFFVNSQRADAPQPQPPEQEANQTQQDTPQNEPAVEKFDMTTHNTEDPASLWVIVNKIKPLPSDYVPGDLKHSGNGAQLRAEAATALERLQADIATQGTPVYVISGYRSYQTQVATYNRYVSIDGQEQADTYSARPGHSEHQTGWAVDVGNGSCDLEICFGDTKAGIWLAQNAHKYGFVVRYPLGKESETGYQYEPWHLRYVGAELAQELFNRAQTMESLFGVVPAAQPY